jgi:hypothetical protein
MSAPTSFLDAQTKYEEIQTYDITQKTSVLREKLTEYITANTATPRVPATVTAKQTALNTAFNDISEYYNKITLINDYLQSYVNQQVKTTAKGASVSGERYTNKVRPQEAVMARETTYGLIPELKMRSLPYLLAISVFMASLTIFLIFQTFGFSGQVNLPPGITAFFSLPASPLPFYSNPLFLGGVIILLIVSLVIFAVLYFKAKNANN